MTTNPLKPHGPPLIVYTEAEKAGAALNELCDVQEYLDLLEISL